MSLPYPASRPLVATVEWRAAPGPRPASAAPAGSLPQPAQTVAEMAGGAIERGAILHASVSGRMAA